MKRQEKRKGEVLKNGEIAKRPVLVWLIILFVAYSASVGLYNYWQIMMYPQAMPESMRPYFEQLNMLDFVLSALTQITYVVAAAFLFQMKRSSLHAWGVAIGISLVASIYHVFIKDWGNVSLSTAQMVSPFLAVIIPVVVWLYSYRLGKKQLLH